MKKFLLSTILMIAVSACGVKRPDALAIQLINANSGVPYAQQDSIAVRAYSLYDVRVDWDVTNTGAQGVEIVAAAGMDYYCQTPIASAVFYVVNSRAVTTTNYLDSLGRLFYNDLGKFVPGNRYAFCLRAVLYDSVSDPSLPVFLELINN
ncbi:MAG: hypothetical protein NTY22_03250 [Proteobacteria bacterium]|nr:hypothetical protein [Pseudomonadota bacterium]